MLNPRTPLLLLPGLLNDAALWQAQMDGLSDIADCVVGDLTRHDTLQAVAAAVLLQAPPSFALAGFSMGGFVAQEILRQAPQRVQRLALLDTSMLADPPERIAQRRALSASLDLPGTFHGFGERLLRSYVDASRLHDHALLEQVRSMTSRLGAQVLARQSRIVRVDGHDVLARYAGKLLVLCGENDAITPLALHQQMAALVPGAELVVLPHCGHLAPLERPAEVTAALRRWLH